MAEHDRVQWDERYRETAAVSPERPALPAHFEPFAEELSGAADVLEIACGVGRAAVWFAQQGARVQAYDISPVAIARASEVAEAYRVADRCHFAVADFDLGLPEGEAVDVVVCNMFRDGSLDDAIIERLRPGGILAIAALSEVGASPGRFRVKPGELVRAFASLEHLGSGEGDGIAWLVARKS